MELVQTLYKLFLSIGAVLVLGSVIRLYESLVKKPASVRARLRKQGITGPPPTVLLGNILEVKKCLSTSAKEITAAAPPITHDYADCLLPFLPQWRKKYGKFFMFAFGNKQILHVARADLVKEITKSTSINLGRPSHNQKEMGPLLGEGILTSNGPLWQYQKKILGPELHMDKIKGMVHLIWESTNVVLDSWKSRIEAEGGVVADIYIDQDLLEISGDVVAKACFGSNFAKGKEIFSKLCTLKEAISQRIFSIGLPGVRYLPTENNREISRLQKEVHALILKVVKERNESGQVHRDFLQTVIQGSKNSNFSPRGGVEHFIVDNCKNIYSAAQETVAVSASWCLMLLASNPEWQDRVRAEVLQIWGAQIPDFDMLRKAKLLTMVIQETQRLYPLAVAFSREALEDLKIGGIEIPKGVGLWMMVSELHTDPETWGPDSYEFKPDRFANGISGACKLPQSYMPFGFGPRQCLGQNLAMLELKLIIGLVLSNFSFRLSPKYIHSPIMKLTIEPKYGIHLSLKKL
ncbi:cytochrome P450 714C2-like [Diospyros lotus]|uniref:cytochrome P450 714C2-like n=1 Tax=Diospyros lotus TaxID=55363 RepID=UPI002255FAFA|nr:cytochrome P450 714C2-like [Diospyros lotus]